MTTFFCNCVACGNSTQFEKISWKQFTECNLVINQFHEIFSKLLKHVCSCIDCNCMSGIFQFWCMVLKFFSFLCIYKNNLSIKTSSQENQIIQSKSSGMFFVIPLETLEQRSQSKTNWHHWQTTFLEIASLHRALFPTLLFSPKMHNYSTSIWQLPKLNEPTTEAKTVQ